MKLLTKGLFAAGLLGAVSLAVPQGLAAQRSGVDIWAQTCGRCHATPPPARYTAERWESVMESMKLQARMTDDEADVALAFLKSGAKRAASQQPATDPMVLARVASLEPVRIATEAGGADIYARQCVACHGKEGKGNGPAAPALSPRPSDLTNHELSSKLTDEELRKIIAEGKGTMPAFGALLKPEELKAVADYVRNLSKANK